MRRLTDLTEVIDKFKNDWNYFLKHELKMQNLEIIVMEDLNFNASAGFRSNHEGEFLIKINEGVFHQIWNFYHRTFNDKNLSIVKMAGFIDENSSCDKDFPVSLANLYVNITINFIFLHELGHIVNNHILYLKNLNYNNDLMMIYPKSKKLEDLNISAYEYQMLEVEADEFATKNIFRIVTNEYLVKGLLNLPSFYTVAPTIKHLCLYIFSSIINERSLQGLGANRAKYDLTKARYIPNRMRLLVILQELTKNMNLFLKNDSYPEKMMLEHIERFESIINLYLIEECFYDESVLSTQNNLDELDEDVFNHINYLKKFIYPNLKKKLKDLSI